MWNPIHRFDRKRKTVKEILSHFRARARSNVKQQRSVYFSSSVVLSQADDQNHSLYSCNYFVAGRCENRIKLMQVIDHNAFIIKPKY